MTKNRKRKAPRPVPTDATQRTTTRSIPAARPSRAPEARPRSIVLAASVALVLLVGAAALAGWLILRDDGETSPQSGPLPIARLDTPDFHSLLIDANDPDQVLFGSHAGIMESQDGGFSWQEGTMSGKDAMSMAMSPQDPSTVYVTGHDVVEVSLDGGLTWQPLQHDLPGTDIHAFAQDPLTPELLYAYVAGQGVFLSENRGANWNALSSQPPGGTPLSLAADGSRVYAATEGGIVTSSDQGATWQRLPAQPAGSTMTLALSPADPLVLYAGTSDGLARSSDGGSSWTTLGPAGVPVLALATAPSDPLRIVFVTQGGGVYRSDDGGFAWRAPE